MDEWKKMELRWWAAVCLVLFLLAILGGVGFGMIMLTLGFK